MNLENIKKTRLSNEMKKYFLPKGATGEVWVGATLHYSGSVYIFSDGTISIPGVGSNFKPGDLVYQIIENEEYVYTTQRKLARNFSIDLLKSGCGSGVLASLVEASNKIDRIYTDKSPGLQPENTFDSVFNQKPTYIDFRYKGIDIREWRFAEEIDAHFGNQKPSETEIEEYYVDTSTDDLSMEIGGFLHLDKGVKMTDELFNAICSWNRLGGRIGRTAHVSMSDFSGDKSDLERANHVYGVEPNE